MTREERLVFFLSHVALPSDRLDEALVRPPFDWERFYNLTLRFANVSLCAYNLETASGKLEIPKRVLDALMRHRSFLEIRQRMFMDELKRMAIACQEKELAFILLKGPVFSYLYYPLPGMRTFIDLDVLLHRADLDALGDLLAAQGFEVARTEQDEIVFGKPFGIPEYALALEVHFHLINMQYFTHYRSADRIRLEPMWERSVTRSINAIELRVFSPEDLLIYACLHHFYHHRFCGLKYFSDLDAMLAGADTGIRWDRFASILREMRVDVKIYTALTTYEKLFGKPSAPASVLEELRPSALQRRLADAYLPGAARLPFSIQEHSFHLPKILALDRWRDMALIAVRWLFPGREFLENFFFVAPGEWKREYYIIYPLEILKKGLKRILFRRPFKAKEVLPHKKLQE